MTDRERGSNLVRRYFMQLTQGCGRKGCPNRYCFSCADGPGQLDRTAAALRSLELAQGAVHHLCDEEPPFLHIELVQELVADAMRTGKLGLLTKEVSSVFSNADALNRSFLQSDAERETLAKALHVEVEETHGLETAAIGEAYCEMLRLQSAEVLGALMNATESLLCKLQLAQLAQPTVVSDGTQLRQFVILLLNPLLLEPQYHKQVLLPLLSLIEKLPPPIADRLSSWWSLLPTRQMEQMVAVCQQFLTVRLCHTQRIDDAVIAATRVLGQLYDANEAAMAVGRRKPSEALDYRRFYNDAINLEVNLKEDYRRWKSARGEFSFCDHPFVLEPASKSRVLMYDATAQMTHEFEGAILRSLFVGATSPYLVIKVRRSHLISDTLLQMGLHKEDLKKPLKVQFVGEDGIDEGGIQKEFFQLIFAKIFDVSYGMFVYDDESRFFWFNRASLENEREFELIGMILGAAIYNGVVLDARFPHIVYKKLMGQPVGLDDLAIAFPLLARSFQQLLDMQSDDDIDSLGLVMQVSFEQWGEQKTFDLVLNGGNVAVTLANRDEYVRLYVQYLLDDSIARQFGSFQRGFHLVCGGECLQLFRWEELELLICGSPVLDFEAFERVAQYDDGFSREHPTVRLMWEVIHALSFEMKKRFLFFCTGSDRVPIKGLGNLNFVISRNGTDEERLPSAHTCFNHLLLPEYKSKEKLKDQLLKAIVDTEGFHII
ncbi:ubiquitin-protein ligase e3a isoform 2 [Chrysochromulina tobinii]|jgi:ubiquitin-protein ligase E3 A|uniref:HECT-type E3 ubiquitin transferase n=1 Tax=Chrysochromulina tobinii TaxID=1460289 RepID=A0A0M0JDW4_9EUKA|nr:ubiquitin-protein ligase e3a isoform 2 [Chrysochromulina tobinii]|eukprot:KOO24665.1 ubiquitin-protein ligase e3a isoform 2 [Chrysochromulina sp. CCMP291]